MHAVLKLEGLAPPAPGANSTLPSRTSLREFLIATVEEIEICLSPRKHRRSHFSNRNTFHSNRNTPPTVAITQFPQIRLAIPESSPEKSNNFAAAAAPACSRLLSSVQTADLRFDSRPRQIHVARRIRSGGAALAAANLVPARAHACAKLFGSCGLLLILCAGGESLHFARASNV
jgi:hypothetical protein